MIFIVKNKYLIPVTFVMKKETKEDDKTLS